ncbi:Uncharacterized protein APZ42_021031 [Daphnia magna]|uniref:Uncharacterized protein n=1 Tax=Daphnia magna TaxID=35525 RepID=A0A164WWM8_9CRUS|nr:Uncharacterized protein APZ42_021031 [Daphnia magna]
MMSYLRMAKRHVCIPNADDNETALIEATQLILDVMPSRLCNGPYEYTLGWDNSYLEQELVDEFHC